MNAAISRRLNLRVRKVATLPDLEDIVPSPSSLPQVSVGEQKLSPLLEDEARTSSLKSMDRKSYFHLKDINPDLALQNTVPR